MNKFIVKEGKTFIPFVTFIEGNKMKQALDYAASRCRESEEFVKGLLDLGLTKRYIEILCNMEGELAEGSLFSIARQHTTKLPDITEEEVKDDIITDEIIQYIIDDYYKNNKEEEIVEFKDVKITRRIQQLMQDPKTKGETTVVETYNLFKLENLKDISPENVDNIKSKIKECVKKLTNMDVDISDMLEIFTLHNNFRLSLTNLKTDYLNLMDPEGHCLLIKVNEFEFRKVISEIRIMNLSKFHNISVYEPSKILGLLQILNSDTISPFQLSIDEIDKDDDLEYLLKYATSPRRNLEEIKTIKDVRGDGKMPEFHQGMRMPDTMNNKPVFGSRKGGF